MIDGLMQHDTELDPRICYTDTHGFTEVVMATAALLGFDLAPRINPSFAVSIEKRENERFLPLNSRHLRGEKTVGGVWDNLPTFRRVLA